MYQAEGLAHIERFCFFLALAFRARLNLQWLLPLRKTRITSRWRTGVRNRYTRQARGGVTWKRLRDKAITMASPLSHPVAALSIGTCFYRPHTPKRVWVAGALCSVVPDLDAIGFRFGIHYGDFWGHRGFTHSLFFAALLSGMVALAIFWSGENAMRRLALFAYLFLATASHGVLDAMTDGGLGVAFFSPFDNTRYFLPWRPIHVSPISVRRFFTLMGFSILRNEAVRIWLPALLFAGMVLAVRRDNRRNTATLRS